MAGLAYSGFLYFRNRPAEFSIPLLYSLAIARFLVVSLTAFLLLSPVVQSTSRTVEKPILVFAQDNSKSLTMIGDSVYYQSDYKAQKQDFLKRLASKFDVRSFVFGESFRKSETVDFEDRATEISQVFDGVRDLFSDRNVGAVVVASDGISNRGINPVFASANLAYPVYTLALGDTVRHRDLILKNIINNRVTFLGNKFPVEVEIEARMLAGANSRLSVSREGQVVYSRNLSLTSSSHFEAVRIDLVADIPGTHRYSVALSPVEGEISVANNRADFFIEVIDGRQQVLIIAAAAHPDVGAVKMALENNDNYQVEAKLIDDFSGSIEKYNLVILHQLPSMNNSATNLLRMLKQSKTPFLVVIGALTNLGEFNNLQLGVTINQRTNDFSESLPAINPGFMLFGIDQRTIALVPNLPPLRAPFAEYKLGLGSQTLVYQKIGTIITSQPLIAFAGTDGHKVGVVAGEGLWRWRMYTHAQVGNHEPFDDLMWKIIQYLSVTEDKSLFRVKTKNIVYENEPIIFEAELYNPSYELVNEPTVSVSIKNQDGLEYNFEMARHNNAYRLDAGRFAPGDYTYKSQTRLGGEIHQAQGRFSILSLNLEGLQTTANHNLLFQIAETSGGELFLQGQWDELARALLQRDDITPILFSQKDFKELINYRLILILLILLLATEWFGRKWSGGY